MFANIIMNLKEDCKHKINKEQKNPSSGNKLDILRTSSISSLEALLGRCKHRYKESTKMDLGETGYKRVTKFN